MVDYGERLSQAMKAAGISTTELAARMGLSYQAVRKVTTGASKAFSAVNNARAASILGVPADQLALGKSATSRTSASHVAEEQAAYGPNVVEPFKGRADATSVRQAAMVLWEASREQQPARVEAVLSMLKELLQNKSDADAAHATADHIHLLLDNRRREKADDLAANG